MTIRIYKSTDSGAPPHPSSLRGSMAALLRACLVTGYGAMTPAGWEEPFAETNNIACFRALQGTARQFYQINDRDYDADVTRMTSYDSMSSVETGEGARGAVYFGKWYSATESFAWLVIADEKTCYVVLQPEDNNIVHGFGEYLSLIADDPCPAFISGSSDSTRLSDDDTNIPLHQAYSITDTTATTGFLRRSISANAHSAFQAINYAAPSGSPLGGSIESYFSGTPVTGVDLLMLPVIVKAIADPPAGITQPCGIMRGMYAPLFKANYSGTYLVGGKTLYSVGTDAGLSLTGRVLFDITGPWD